MNDITITITMAECADIVTLLGNLPTSSNAYGLWAKVKAQLDGAIVLQNNPTPPADEPQEPIEGV
jgi:hypothetical protein